MHTEFRPTAKYLLVPLLVPILMLGFFIAGLDLGASGLPAAMHVEGSGGTGGPSMDIQARRVISIPFGIESNLAINREGSMVDVWGSGTCPEGGEDYLLRVMVRQESTGAQALGRSENSCSVDRWAAGASALGAKTFEAGPAEVCAMVVIFFDQAGAVPYKWCKQVTLQN